jgi:transcriptional regulator with XRE-family HTH domain
LAKGFQDERYRRLVEQLVARRTELGLSQQAVATKLATHQQFVSRYETGERRLDAVEFLDVAYVLGLNAGTMLESVPPSSTNTKKRTKKSD